jgi:hypothetical protein
VAAWNGAGDINQLVDATPDKEWFEQYLGGFAKGKALEKGRRRREGAA